MLLGLICCYYLSVMLPPPSATMCTCSDRLSQLVNLFLRQFDNTLVIGCLKKRCKNKLYRECPSTVIAYTVLVCSFSTLFIHSTHSDCFHSDGALKSIICPYYQE